MVKIKFEYKKMFPWENVNEVSVFERDFNIFLVSMEPDFIEISDLEFSEFCKLSQIIISGDNYIIEDIKYHLNTTESYWTYFVRNENDVDSGYEELPF